MEHSNFDDTETILIMNFRAFDKVCKEPFINKTIEEAKQHIRTNICETAIFLTSYEYEVIQVNILQKALLNG